MANLIEKDGACHVSHLFLSIPAARHTLMRGSHLVQCLYTKHCCRDTSKRSIGALLLRWYEISSLLVPKLHLVAQHVYVQQLPDVLLAVILCKDAQTQSVRLGRLQGCRATATIDGPGMLPVMVLFDANFFRIFPSSLSTLAFSCSLF